MDDRERAPLVAVTGASGFIGRRLVPALVQSGYRVRLLLRRDPVVREWRMLKPEVVAGDLGNRGALERLVEGAQAIVHVAGAIKAARRDQFFAANRDGSEGLARAAVLGAPQAHFIQVSSQAAREPALSDYAASKRAGEDAVFTLLGDRVTVVRPPAVYGPGDPESLIFFQLARKKRIPLLGKPAARAAMIHVDDLVNLLAMLCGKPPTGAVLMPSDERRQGYSWLEILTAAAHAVGNAQPRFFQAPIALLHAVAFGGDIVRLLGSANMLNSQKLREIRHPDWSVQEHERVRLADWAPHFTLESGFADAVAWYRSVGWLP